MALIICPECGKEVSDKAPACIHCGFPFAAQKTNDDAQIICPKCGSNQVTTGPRGYTLRSGVFGSNKTVNRCGKCGHMWDPK